MIVNCRRTTQWDVYCGREMPGYAGSKWGNPFRVGSHGTRDEVIAKYREWIVKQPELMAALPELRGKILGCWCAPQQCHCEVLEELIAALPTEVA